MKKTAKQRRNASDLLDLALDYLKTKPNGCTTAEMAIVLTQHARNARGNLYHWRNAGFVMSIEQMRPGFNGQKQVPRLVWFLPEHRETAVEFDSRFHMPLGEPIDQDPFCRPPVQIVRPVGQWVRDHSIKHRSIFEFGASA